MSKQKPKLIYILGTGHSGSTLLELIMSTAPNTFSVGGFRYIDRYVAGSNGVTHDDMGDTALESPMWSELAEHTGEYILDNPQEPTLSFTNRLRILLTGTPNRIPHRYHNHKLYKYVQKKASEITREQIEYIIDSSKTLARLMEIKERTDFDIFVVHLIRDVRGVANSNIKRNMPVLKSAKIWLTDNLYASAYVKKHIAQDKQMRIHYEDFVAQPEKYIEEINHKTGLQIDFGAIVPRINEQESYRFAGNEMRRGEFTGIRQDIKWRTQLPRLYRMLLAPLMLVFK